VGFAEPFYICWPYSDYTPNRYFFNGDTSVINGNVYHHMIHYPFIELDGQSPICGPFAVDTIPDLSWPVLIREDTVNQKVYINAGNTEYLLFDFSLNQGDTSYLPDIFEGDYILIDTVYQFVTEDGVSRKMIEFEDEWGLWGWMLEGIGGAAGPAWFPFSIGINGSGPWMMCVEYKNGNPVFSGECDDFLTGIGDQSSLNDETEIYPNPFKDYIRIKWNKKIKNAALLDITGTIKQSIHPNTNEFIIYTSGLKDGFYIIQIIDESNQVHQRKLIKSNNL
jgi:hypothetical protein